MNKLFVGLCASICLLSLATDAQAVRLGGRTTIRPHKSYTPPPRTYRPAPVDFSQVCERSSQWCELRYS
ncbi:MAG: hypothetical protein ACLTHA_05955, partial [Parasutterella sp.]